MLQTNASAFAISATLTQPDMDNMHYPVALLLASLQPAEVNYDIYDCELLAIVKVFCHWHHHLLGASHPITILTDHNNLTYFHAPHKISSCQAHWMETLADFDFILHHVPGHANTIADPLSCHPDLKEGVHSINDNVTVLPNTLFVNCVHLITNDKKCQAVHDLHDTTVAGHPGIVNT